MPSCRFRDRIMPNMISRNGKLKTHPLPTSKTHTDNQNRGSHPKFITTPAWCISLNPFDSRVLISDFERGKHHHVLLKAWVKSISYGTELSCQRSPAPLCLSRWTGRLQRAERAGANTHAQSPSNLCWFGWTQGLDLQRVVSGWQCRSAEPALLLSLMQKALQCSVLLCFILTGDKAFCWSHQILWEIGLQESLPLHTIWQWKHCVEELSPTCSLTASGITKERAYLIIHLTIFLCIL